MASAREIVKKLRADCDTLAATLRQQAIASETEINAQRPGATENPSTGWDGWLSYFRWLHRTHAAGGPDRDTRRNTIAHPDEGVVFDAVSSVPERVELVEPIPGPDGALIDAVLVHPKGLNALILCHRLNLQVGFLSSHLEEHKEILTAHDLEVSAIAWERLQRHLCQLAWIVTTPGSGRPFDPLVTPTPELPEWIGNLAAIDLHRIVQAYQKVNAIRLLALDRMVAPVVDGVAQRPSWSIFAADRAGELGIRESELREDRDLPALVAGMRLRHESQRRAQASAEARAERKRPRQNAGR